MAKSQRASSTKRNNAVLRSKVFNPATEARTARLSAKLQELASKPRPNEERKMDVDALPEATKNTTSTDAVNEDGTSHLQWSVPSPLLTRYRYECRRKGQISEEDDWQEINPTLKNPHHKVEEAEEQYHLPRSTSKKTAASRVQGTAEEVITKL